MIAALTTVGASSAEAVAAAAALEEGAAEAAEEEEEEAAEAEAETERGVLMDSDLFDFGVFRADFFGVALSLALGVETAEHNTQKKVG